MGSAESNFGPRLGLRDFFWGGLAITSAAAVNLARLSMIAMWPQHFETIHGPFGAQIAGGLTIVLIVVICMIGQRRELFAPA